MPKELKSQAEFDRILEHATEVRVYRKGDQAKIKLRTKESLYTFKTTSEGADSLIKGIKKPVLEL